MKRFGKVILCAAIVFFSTVLSFSLYSKILEQKIDKLYVKKQTYIQDVNNSKIKEKGSALVEQSTKRGELQIFGSSELSSPVEQNIKNNFPNDLYGKGMSRMGRAHVQNNLHAMELGANSEAMKNSNVVIIQSMQWFYNDDIKVDGYMANFSELQFYKFLQNPKISKENKEYLCRRFLELEGKRSTYKSEEEVSKGLSNHRVLNFFQFTSKYARGGWLKIKNQGYDYPQTHLLAKLYLDKGVGGKIVYLCMKPYYRLKFHIMDLKDKSAAYMELDSLINDSGKREEEFSTDWDAQLKKAEEQGKKACTNNDIYTSDEYFEKNLAPIWKEKKGSGKETDLMGCKEWEDYEFLLRVCKETGINPLFINVSGNAYYYDYIDISRKRREEYYKRNKETAERYGFTVYNDLTEKEYEPYIFYDVMHLGWKGWIYVTKAIVEHFQ